MSRVRARGEDIRRFILDRLEKHPSDISKVTAQHFEITRQAVNKHLQKLGREGCLTETGQTRNRVYKLAPLQEWDRAYRLAPGLTEDVAWNDIRPQLGPLPDNVLNIWQYVFTEMFNNAIDHSGGKEIRVNLVRTATSATVAIRDDGIGIFKKIQAALELADERHAILELSKGKLTTDPKRHTGEGIFFSSRAVDSYDILSGGVYFSHEFGKPEDWILERKPSAGTTIFMKLHNHTSRTLKKVFDTYSSGDDYGFNKTVVPVVLAKYGNDQLVSRSQAKRVLARVDLFKVVLFDFANVESVGQAFADEIFRVFQADHPKIEIVPVNANSAVKRMVERVKSGVPDDVTSSSTS